MVPAVQAVPAVRVVPSVQVVDMDLCGLSGAKQSDMGLRGSVWVSVVQVGPRSRYRIDVHIKYDSVVLIRQLIVFNSIFCRNILRQLSYVLRQVRLHHKPAPPTEPRFARGTQIGSPAGENPQRK